MRETPKTLIQSIRNGQNKYLDYEREAQNQKLTVRDFLAQQFGIAILKNPECQTILLDLYKRLIRE